MLDADRLAARIDDFADDVLDTSRRVEGGDFFRKDRALRGNLPHGAQPVPMLASGRHEPTRHRRPLEKMFVVADGIEDSLQGSCDYGLRVDFIHRSTLAVWS